MNQYFNDELSFFLTKVSFDTSEGKQLSYFQNGNFFKIILWCHEPYNYVKCGLKNEINFSTFYKQNIESKFVLVLIVQTLWPLLVYWKIIHFTLTLHLQTFSKKNLHLNVAKVDFYFIEFSAMIVKKFNEKNIFHLTWNFSTCKKHFINQIFTTMVLSIILLM